MPGDGRTTRPSGEHRVPLEASANLSALSTAVQMGFQNISDRFDEQSRRTEDHVAGLVRRLDSGAARMDRIDSNTSEVKASVAALVSRMNAHSETIKRMESSEIPLPVPELKTKGAKLLTPIYNAIVTVIVSGTMVWILRGGAAPIVNANNPLPVDPSAVPQPAPHHAP